MEQTHKFKILVIDDEIQIHRLLRITLEANDYKVLSAETGRLGLQLAAMDHPDLILLDLGLPDIEGMLVLKKLREWSTIPLILLTVIDDGQVVIEGLNSGADDYITKPFHTGELLARIRVAIRHSLKLDESPVLKNGPLTADLNNRIVKLNGEEIRLTVMEYNLLSLFFKNIGKVLTHSFISKTLWGNQYAENAQTLRVHIAQLRKKIEPNSSVPQILVTEPGVGYRFVIW